MSRDGWLPPGVTDKDVDDAIQTQTEETECPSCHEPVEDWWSYCAVCGWHLASGEQP